MCVGTNGFWWSLSNLQKEGLDSLIMKQRCRGSQGKIWTKHCFVRTHVDMLISSCDGESQRTVICFWACISYRLLTKWGNAKQQCYRKMGWGLFTSKNNTFGAELWSNVEMVDGKTQFVRVQSQAALCSRSLTASFNVSFMNRTTLLL